LTLLVLNTCLKKARN